MTRFYVPEIRLEQGSLKIEGGEVRHIRRVLRLRIGDEITIFDGSGKEYKGTIAELCPSSAVMAIHHVSYSKRESPLEITLAQSLLKGEKMDYLVQKATELGVNKILPFLSSRSIPFPEKEKRLERHHRWEKIAIEASKQCGRGVLPKIESVQDYADVLESLAPEALRLILWEKEGMGLKEVLQQSKEQKRVFFIVGPEGGLSEEEVQSAKERGFIPILLGERILRSETASLCLLGILQYEWGDIGQKKRTNSLELALSTGKEGE